MSAGHVTEWNEQIPHTEPWNKFYTELTYEMEMRFRSRISGIWNFYIILSAAASGSFRKLLSIQSLMNCELSWGRKREISARKRQSTLFEFENRISILFPILSRRECGEMFIIKLARSVSTGFKIESSNIPNWHKSTILRHTAALYLSDFVPFDRVELKKCLTLYELTELGLKKTSRAGAKKKWEQVGATFSFFQFNVLISSLEFQCHCLTCDEGTSRFFFLFRCGRNKFSSEDFPIFFEGGRDSLRE